jgi:hypothetical protein
MVINATVREISKEAVLLDMERNSPYIYVTFGGYDWISHYRGPRAISSFNLLKEIDANVKKLYLKARKKGYDFYVLSDHGQIPSMPFDRKYHESFEHFLQRISSVKAKEVAVEGDERSSRAKYIVYKLGYYYKNFSLPLRAFTWALIKVMKYPFREKKKDPSIDWKKKEQLIVFNSSSLAQLYFNYTPNRMSLSDIEKKHPFFVSRLVNHPGVGFVIGKQGDAIEVISAAGKVIINGKKVKFVGERFLKRYGDEKKLVKQIQYFAHIKYTGDLIINGDYDGERIVAFEEYHFGSHDSIGGDQNDAFFISKKKIDLNHVLNAKDLYHIFLQYHRKKGL